MRLDGTCSTTLLMTVFLSPFYLSECLQTTVLAAEGSAVTVSANVDECAVCRVTGANDTQAVCHPSLALPPVEEVTLLFNCSRPLEQAYSVKVQRTIECTKDSCSPKMGDVQSSILPEFARTFAWDLKAPEKFVVVLDILGQGLNELAEPTPCPDGFQYTASKMGSSGKAKTQTYCRGGSLTSVELPNQITLSLKVEPNVKVDSVVFTASSKPLKGRTVVVTSDPDTAAVVISRDAESPECEVCSHEGSSPTCSPTDVTLTDPKNVSVEFLCPQPQEVFSVQVKKKIECTVDSCSPATGAVQPGLLEGFQRTLSWDVSVPKKTVLTLEFPAEGLKETTGAAPCQDGYKYSFHSTNGQGEVRSRGFCRKGPVTQLELIGTTTVAVDIPKGAEPAATAFTAKAMPRRGRAMSVTPDPHTIITVSRVTPEPDCEVCAGDGPSRKCDPKYLTMKIPQNTSVEFSCPQPQDVFRVEINREIDCTETACSGNIVQAESSMFPDFNRTFVWDLKAPSTRTFQIYFPEPGIRQIPKGDACPDQHTYTFVTYLRTGPAEIGTYCKGGAISTVQVRYKGRMLLAVPGDRKLEPLDLKLSVGPETNMLAIMKVDLPRGVSETEFTTAKYPEDFPDEDQMRWDFMVPGMHNYTVHFIDHMLPECLDKDVVLEYHTEDKKTAKLALSDPQPKQRQGSFNMSLWNCKTNRTLQGLALNFKVSVMRSGHPVLCTVDLTQKEGLSLQISKVGSDPYCEMSINSVVKENIDVPTGTKASLSFLDCPDEDVRLTGSKIIACQNLSSCSVAHSLLTVPQLDSCLPLALHSFTWKLQIPQHGTVELASPTGSLRQSLPGQECNGSVSMRMAEEGGSPISDYCHGGIIQKVQVNSNVSVTVTAQDFTKTRGPFLNVSFIEEIAESIIYTVMPKVSSPALLATPNWPNGMKSSSTVSWIVNLPSQYGASLKFLNISQPKCGQRHTSIKVQQLGYEKEMLSLREDEEAQDRLDVPRSFFLNMSNCMPEQGEFGVVTKVVLQKNNSLLAIILGVIGALLLIAAVLAAVILVTRKKKGRMSTESSIYIGKGSIFRPSDQHFSKARSDNGSHVYASIDETMMYGHLLRDSSYGDRFNNPQMDSYRTFMGPVEAGPPAIVEPEAEPGNKDQYQPFLDPSESFLPPRPRTPIDREDSLGFQDRRMVDNELYTFKSTGDMNTIRLSGVEIEPLEESL